MKFEDFVEIQVTTADGKKYIFKDDGIEKFRRKFLQQATNEINVQMKTKYSTPVSVDYAPSTLSAKELAEQMRQQSGLTDMR